MTPCQVPGSKEPVCFGNGKSRKGFRCCHPHNGFYTGVMLSQALVHCMRPKYANLERLALSLVNGRCRKVFGAAILSRMDFTQESGITSPHSPYELEICKSRMASTVSGQWPLSQHLGREAVETRIPERHASSSPRFLPKAWKQSSQIAT